MRNCLLFCRVLSIYCLPSRIYFFYLKILESLQYYYIILHGVVVTELVFISSMVYCMPIMCKASFKLIKVIRGASCGNTFILFKGICAAFLLRLNYYVFLN